MSACSATRVVTRLGHREQHPGVCQVVNKVEPQRGEGSVGQQFREKRTQDGGPATPSAGLEFYQEDTSCWLNKRCEMSRGQEIWDFTVLTHVLYKIAILPNVPEIIILNIWQTAVQFRLASTFVSNCQTYGYLENSAVVVS